MPKSSKKISNHKNTRGAVLTTFLAIISFGAGYAIVKQISYLLTRPMSITMIEAMAVIVLSSIAIFMMWQWKKWGVYLYAAAILLTVLFPLLHAHFHAVGTMAMATILIFFLLFLIIRPRWSKFA